MTVEVTVNALSSVAKYADLPLSDAELANFEGLLFKMLETMRATPNEALAAVEPATIFRHIPTEDIPDAGISSAIGEPGAASAADLAFMSVAEAASLIKAGKLSPLELTQAVLAQIEKVNPKLEAFVTITGETALQAAKQAETDIARGNWRGPLHGIPFALKDLIETENILTTGSSKVLPDYFPTRHAAVSEKLLEAGGILMGKVHTHEFAFGMMTPPTRNPYNSEHIPGGSSGGSGAAVASGMAAMAIGTDTGGSIRIPAAFCGTVGLKPTYGRVSRRGIFSLSWSLDHAGPMTRRVEDAALMLQAIAGYDPLDGASASVPVADYHARLKDGVKGLKIGICKVDFLDRAHPAVAAAVMEGARELAELGAELIEVKIPNLDEVYPINMLIVLAEASSYHQKWLRSKGELYTPDVRAFLQAGELVLATDYLQAQRRRSVFVKSLLGEVLSKVDLLLLPTMPVVAPEIGQLEVSYPGYTGSVMDICINFTGPFNLSGLPALTVPCGFSQGLPIGLQLVGRPFEEVTVLQAGYAYEQATEWHKQRPPV
jgi:aspartyl-tRNA(Asn)/glutamyl-tRNA(Gln) amidotransferase subunit A